MTAIPPGWSAQQILNVTSKPIKLEPTATGRDRVRYVDIGLLEGPERHLATAPEVLSGEAPSRCRQVIASGDTLYSTVRPYLRKVAMVSDDLHGEFASTGYAVLRPTEAIDPSFLFYFTLSKHFEDQLLPLQKGVSYPAVLDREVRAQRVWFPELHEQRRIVEILEDHLTHLDVAHDSLVRARQRSESMVASARLRMLENAMGGAVSKLGDIAAVGTGTTPSRSRADYHEDGSIPWVTSGDLAQGLIEEPVQFVTERAFTETSLKLYPVGTLLVAMYGEGKTRGTVAELGITATTNQACAAVQVHDEKLRPWVRAVLDANYNAMRRLAAGGVQPNLNLGMVRQIEIPIPEEEDRARLLGELRAVLDSASALATDVDRSRARVSALRRSLLVAAFEGKLAGRNADTEVIEELAHV